MRDSKRYPADIGQKQARFAQQVAAGIRKVQGYEDLQLQALALETIPIETLNERAQSRLQTLPAAQRSNKDDVIKMERHCILLELLAWFKKEFFKWADNFTCDSCGEEAPCTFSGMTEPSQFERADGAGRVELHACQRCARVKRFPRYDHPRKLLETRLGRCGEWANCFTLCVRSMGFEARLAMDWTDHVWTEVWSDLDGRWLHCDSCENVCDEPLLYEQGWGKKLTYVIAVSVEEVQDVTWRYSKDHKATRARRLECRDRWLIRLIEQHQLRLAANLSPDRQQLIERRRIAELVEMLVPLEPKEPGKLGGRTSGSLAWRLARGECGTSQ